MSIYTGESVDRPQETGKKRLPKNESRGKKKFIMMVHPDKWKWDGKEYQPKLGSLTVEPGLQGVVVRGGRVDTSRARAHYLEKGWTLIENGDPRLEPVLENGVYLHRYLCENGQYAYVCKWASPYQLMGRTKWKLDKELYNKVSKHIRDNIMSPMGKEIKEHYIDLARHTLQRNEALVSSNPSILNKAKLKKAQDDLKARLDDLKKAYPDG